MKKEKKEMKNYIIASGHTSQLCLARLESSNFEALLALVNDVETPY
jgi:hypothetical protein